MGKKSNLEQLTANQKKALAHWYGTDAFKAAVRLAELEVIGLGADSLIATDIQQTRYLYGKSKALEEFFKLIHLLYKEENQDS